MSCRAVTKIPFTKVSGIFTFYLILLHSYFKIKSVTRFLESNMQYVRGLLNKFNSVHILFHMIRIKIIYSNIDNYKNVI